MIHPTSDSESRTEYPKASPSPWFMQSRLISKVTPGVRNSPWCWSTSELSQAALVVGSLQACPGDKAKHILTQTLSRKHGKALKETNQNF